MSRNEEICKKCIYHYKDYVLSNLKIFCIKVKKDPLNISYMGAYCIDVPNDCRYKLEHVVLGQE